MKKRRCRLRRELSWLVAAVCYSGSLFSPTNLIMKKQSCKIVKVTNPDYVT